jgi:hypothetical protein
VLQQCIGRIGVGVHPDPAANAKRRDDAAEYQVALQAAAAGAVACLR